jgi:hypothetical protein
MIYSTFLRLILLLHENMSDKINQIILFARGYSFNFSEK